MRKKVENKIILINKMIIYVLFINNRYVIDGNFSRFVTKTDSEYVKSQYPKLETLKKVEQNKYPLMYLGMSNLMSSNLVKLKKNLRDRYTKYISGKGEYSRYMDIYKYVDSNQVNNSLLVNIKVLFDDSDGVTDDLFNNVLEKYYLKYSTAVIKEISIKLTNKDYCLRYYNKNKESILSKAKEKYSMVKK